MVQQWKVLALLNLAFVAADIQVYPKADPFILLADFYDEEANFGEDIPKRGINTGVVVANDTSGCGPIRPPPNVPNPPSHWAVLIRRYNCSFEEKVINAQNAFYDVAIVHNVDSNKLEIMNASHPELIHIMAIFISANTGREIKAKYLYEQGFVIRIEPNSSGDILGRILIPFIVVISACFILMVGFMVIKCVKDYRRARRRRMPYSTLNRIPTTKFRKNDPYEVCAICLDDFIEGEKLRVLPCSHAYHSKCIDPWLTRNRRVCPMCKRKVFAADEHPESNGSSSEDDDHTPLLRGRNAPTNNTYSTVSNPHDPDRHREAIERMQRARLMFQRDRERRTQRESQQSSRQERGSNSSSGSGNYETSSSISNFSGLVESFQQVIQGILTDDDSVTDPHHEDHHGPGHGHHPEPERDSSGSPTDAQEYHGTSSPQTAEAHTGGAVSDHHEVTFNDVTTVDCHSHGYIDDHTGSALVDDHLEVNFNDVETIDCHSSHDC